MRAHPSQIQQNQKIVRLWIEAFEEGRLRKTELHRELDESFEFVLNFACGRPVKPVRERDLLIELGREFLKTLLKLLQETCRLAEPATNQSAEAAQRHAASRMIVSLADLVSMVSRHLDLDVRTEPLDRIARAIRGLNHGHNNRLLVAGQFRAALEHQSYSDPDRQIIQAQAAALVEALTDSKTARSQTDATQRVADALQRAGYQSTGLRSGAARILADTVKRWHNRAKELSKGIALAGHDEFLRQARFEDALFVTHYLSTIPSLRRKAVDFKYSHFDFAYEFQELERLCRRLKTV